MLPALLLLPLAACDGGRDGADGSRTDAAPDVVIWLVDTLRADHITPYGYERDTSPVMARLAGEGVLFEEAHVHSNWTQPSVTSLLTGMNPLPFRQDFQLRVPQELLLAAEWFAAHGYRTAGFTTTMATAGQFGYDQGFHHYREIDGDLDEEARSARTGTAFEAGTLVDTTLAWLDEHHDRTRDGPLFLYLHTVDPHQPYHRHPGVPDFAKPYRGPQDGSIERIVQAQQDASFQPEDKQHLIALYDHEVAYNDAQLGRFLAALAQRGRGGNLLVLVVADHGEELFDRSTIAHGHGNLHRELTHVPLIVWWPGRLPAGTRLTGLMRGIDVLPTLLDLVGLPPLPSTDGRSVARAVRGDAPLAEARTGSARMVIDRAKGEDDTVAVRDDDWLFIRPPEPGSGKERRWPRLYDLRADSREWQDVAAAHPERTRIYREAIERWIQGREARLRTLGARVLSELDAETRARLEQLGYLR